MSKPGRRSKIAVGSQSRRTTRLSWNRESESLRRECGVTVTRVSVSEPSRREKEPERGSFGAKQRICRGSRKKKREREIEVRSVSKEFVAVDGPGRDASWPKGRFLPPSRCYVVAIILFVNLVSRGTRANFRFPNGGSLTRDRVDEESGSNR